MKTFEFLGIWRQFCIKLVKWLSEQNKMKFVFMSSYTMSTYV